MTNTKAKTNIRTKIYRSPRRAASGQYCVFGRGGALVEGRILVDISGVAGREREQIFEKKKTRLAKAFEIKQKKKK
jgi:hypothetical protein